MSEKQISKSVQILHLDVSAGEHITLLVVLDKPNCNVCFSDREFV